MNEYPPREDYRAFNRPRRRLNLTSVLLFMLGLTLGIFYTNRFSVDRPSVDASNAVLAEAQVFGGGDLAAAQAYDRVVSEVAKKAMPAVVSVHNTGTVVVRYRDPFFDMFYGPQKERFSGMGSGVIIDPSGIVVTNDHVIRMRGQIGQLDVILTDGRKFRAKVVKDIPEQDLAILRIEGKNFPHLSIGSSKDVAPGQTVLAIGNPFGDALNGGHSYGEPTVTRGIISATKRNLTVPTDEGNGERYYRSMLQTDAAINPGNSGGALIDLRGNLIGINTAIYSESGGSVGIGFAIPADRVNLIRQNMGKKNDDGQWYTGIAVQDLTRDIADALGFKGEGGTVITKIDKGSPAEKSGLKRGDVIVRVNGFVTVNSEELISMFHGSLPGENIRLTVFREGKTFDADLTLGSK